MSKRRTQNAMEVKPDPTRQVTLLYNGSPKEIASKKIVLLFFPSLFPLDPPLEFTNPIANCIFHSPKYIHIHHSYLILPLYHATYAEFVFVSHSFIFLSLAVLFSCSPDSSFLRHFFLFSRIQMQPKHVGGKC